jgi:hypothetical protein
MKYSALLSALVVSGLLLFSGCATMQASERSTETKMIVIQEKVEDGEQTGVLAPDQSRIYLATLKDIRTEYAGMSGKNSSRQKMDSLRDRLDVLEQVVNKALIPPKKADEPEDTFWERVGRDLGILERTENVKAPTIGDRMIKVQKRIDDGRNSGAFDLSMADGFQAKMDYIRKEYLRMMEGGRTPPIEEKELISRLLNSLEDDLNHVQRL